MTTVEKLLDIQRSEWERQLAEEVREPDGSAGGGGGVEGVSREELRGDTGLWLWAGPVHPGVLGASSGHHRALSEGFVRLGRAFGRLVRGREKLRALDLSGWRGRWASKLVGKQGVRGRRVDWVCRVTELVADGGCGWSWALLNLLL